MTATPCAICGRPTLDGYACSGCTGRAAGHLAAIIELADDARAVARGEVRRGDGGSSAGKPGSRPPLNDGATDVVHAVQNALTTMAREIAETRGLKIGRDGGPSPLRATLPDERAALVPASTLETLEAS
jgi:hypothetical protein